MNSLSRYKQVLAKILFDLPGWRTDKKIIVFESDDWGSIRMPSKEIYENCLKHGYRVDKNIFSRYDSLASETDLTLLFDLLLSFKDHKANPPIITANCLVANPDFDKIRESDFKQYYFEMVTDTFLKYPQHSRCFEIWKEGINKKIFMPQSHGREHLNVSKFMRNLQAGDKDAHFAFNYKMPGIFKKNAVEPRNDYIISLEYYDEKDKLDKERIIEEGLILFRELFGFSSQSFIAPNYKWDPGLELVLSSNDVRYIQGSRYQYIPKSNFSGLKQKYHFLGENNKLKQIYLTRNVYFEPTLFNSSDCVASTLRQIDIAFKLRKPAIICSHRINYIGFIDQGNRDRNLILLRRLLRSIMQRWPEVEFMTTVELGDLILKKGMNN